MTYEIQDDILGFHPYCFISKYSEELKLAEKP